MEFIQTNFFFLFLSLFDQMKRNFEKKEDFLTKFKKKKKKKLGKKLFVDVYFFDFLHELYNLTI